MYYCYDALDRMRKFIKTKNTTLLLLAIYHLSNLDQTTYKLFIEYSRIPFCPVASLAASSVCFHKSCSARRHLLIFFTLHLHPIYLLRLTSP